MYLQVLYGLTLEVFVYIADIQMKMRMQDNGPIYKSPQKYVILCHDKLISVDLGCIAFSGGSSFRGAGGGGGRGRRQVG